MPPSAGCCQPEWTSIEKKYGRPVAEWKELVRSSHLTRHMELVSW
ncbi:DUF4287 domain-containing protein, partial [Streptomyces sp. NPDC048430]